MIFWVLLLLADFLELLELLELLVLLLVEQMESDLAVWQGLSLSLLHNEVVQGVVV